MAAETSGSDVPLVSKTMSSNIQTPKEVPRVILSVRLNENMQGSELSSELFAEWLRTIPVIAEEVKVEAGWASF
jgi:hypothetical protein